MNNIYFKEATVETSAGNIYHGLRAIGETSAVVILRAGAVFETGLRRVLPDCRTGRLLIQSNIRNGEPELHYLKLPEHIETHDSVLILDPQVSVKILGAVPFQPLTGSCSQRPVAARAPAITF